jgi:hypothetical protein
MPIQRVIKAQEAYYLPDFLRRYDPALVFLLKRLSYNGLQMVFLMPSQSRCGKSVLRRYAPKRFAGYQSAVNLFPLLT